MNDYDTLWKEYESLMLDFSDLLDAANNLTFFRQGSDFYAEAEKVVERINRKYGSIE